MSARKASSRGGSKQTSTASTATASGTTVSTKPRKRKKRGRKKKKRSPKKSASTTKVGSSSVPRPSKQTSESSVLSSDDELTITIADESVGSAAAASAARSGATGPPSKSKSALSLSSEISDDKRRSSGMMKRSSSESSLHGSDRKRLSVLGRKADSLSRGDVVLLSSNRVGVVRYAGPIMSAGTSASKIRESNYSSSLLPLISSESMHGSELIYGIEIRMTDGIMGDSDGSFEGTRYFTCAKNSAIFTRDRSAVIRSYTAEDLLEMVIVLKENLQTQQQRALELEEEVFELNRALPLSDGMMNEESKMVDDSSHPSLIPIDSTTQSISDLVPPYTQVAAAISLTPKMSDDLSLPLLSDSHSGSLSGGGLTSSLSASSLPSTTPVGLGLAPAKAMSHLRVGYESVQSEATQMARKLLALDPDDSFEVEVSMEPSPSIDFDLEVRAVDALYNLTSTTYSGSAVKRRSGNTPTATGMSAHNSGAAGMGGSSRSAMMTTTMDSLRIQPDYMSHMYSDSDVEMSPYASDVEQYIEFDFAAASRKLQSRRAEESAQMDVTDGEADTAGSYGSSTTIRTSSSAAATSSPATSQRSVERGVGSLRPDLSSTKSREISGSLPIMRGGHPRRMDTTIIIDHPSSASMMAHQSSTVPVEHVKSLSIRISSPSFEDESEDRDKVPDLVSAAPMGGRNALSPSAWKFPSPGSSDVSSMHSSGSPVKGRTGGLDPKRHTRGRSRLLRHRLSILGRSDMLRLQESNQALPGMKPSVSTGVTDYGVTSTTNMLLHRMIPLRRLRKDSTIQSLVLDLVNFGHWFCDEILKLDDESVSLDVDRRMSTPTEGDSPAADVVHAPLLASKRRGSAMMLMSTADRRTSTASARLRRMSKKTSVDLMDEVMVRLGLYGDSPMATPPGSPGITHRAATASLIRIWETALSVRGREFWTQVAPASMDSATPISLASGPSSSMIPSFTTALTSRATAESEDSMVTPLPMSKDSSGFGKGLTAAPQIYATLKKRDVHRLIDLTLNAYLWDEFGVTNAEIVLVDFDKAIDQIMCHITPYFYEVTQLAGRGLAVSGDFTAALGSVSAGSATKPSTMSLSDAMMETTPREFQIDNFNVSHYAMLGVWLLDIEELEMDDEYLDEFTMEADFHDFTQYCLYRKDSVWAAVLATLESIDSKLIPCVSMSGHKLKKRRKGKRMEEHYEGFKGKHFRVVMSGIIRHYGIHGLGMVDMTSQVVNVRGYAAQLESMYRRSCMDDSMGNYVNKKLLFDFIADLPRLSAPYLDGPSTPAIDAGAHPP